VGQTGRLKTISVGMVYFHSSIHFFCAYSADCPKNSQNQNIYGLTVTVPPIFGGSLCSAVSFLAFWSCFFPNATLMPVPNVTCLCDLFIPITVIIFSDIYLGKKRQPWDLKGKLKDLEVRNAALTRKLNMTKEQMASERDELLLMHDRKVKELEEKIRYVIKLLNTIDLYV